MSFKRAMALLKILLLNALISFNISAQVSIDTSSIKSELNFIRERDQKTRKGIDSVSFINYIDSCNLVHIESIIEKYGWPGISFVGPSGNQTVFLVIQHANLSIQEKYLPLLKKSVDENQSRACDLALLQDRILMRKGEKQIYGTQIVFGKSGGQEFYPIEDEKKVNERRKSVGLEPIEEYAKHFGIEYKIASD